MEEKMPTQKLKKNISAFYLNSVVNNSLVMKVLDRPQGARQDGT